MTKYIKISVLARETAKKVCRGREQWIRYLDVASRLYKYLFEDQLLIYAQRPDATACASLEKWNERMFTTEHQRLLMKSCRSRTKKMENSTVFGA